MKTKTYVMSATAFLLTAAFSLLAAPATADDVLVTACAGLHDESCVAYADVTRDQWDAFCSGVYQPAPGGTYVVVCAGKGLFIPAPLDCVVYVDANGFPVCL